MNDIRQDIFKYFEDKGVFLLDSELDEIINISTSKILAMHDELYKENEELKQLCAGAMPIYKSGTSLFNEWIRKQKGVLYLTNPKEGE